MAVMRAKMRVSSVQSFTLEDGTVYSENLYFSAVCPSTFGPDGEDENNTFARWTPTAELTMTVLNPALFGRIKQGEEYYLDFTLAKAVE